MSVSSSNLTKLKTNLSLSIQRLKLLEKKKTELAQKSRKEIADYISAGKSERAKIRVEHIIREDYMVEAMEIVEMYCDTLLARFGMIEQMKTLDEGIEEAVSSLIWVAPRMQSDVKELKVVHDVLMMKYGKAYAQAARENQLKTVNERLMIKMGVQAPPKILVERYLIEIAKSLNVEYEPDEAILREDDLYRKGGNSGGSGGNFRIAEPGLPPPPPGPAGHLIDLASLEPTCSQPQGLVLPPPLPMVPPSGGPYPPEPSKNNGNIGFVNMGSASAAGSSSAESKHSMANQPLLPPSIPAGAMSVPPSYDSVVTGQNGVPGNGHGQIPDFDESSLPSVPNLPEIPSDDEEDEDPKKGGSGNTGANNQNSGDFDFDDLRRRFAELKKKK